MKELGQFGRGLKNRNQPENVCHWDENIQTFQRKGKGKISDKICLFL